MSLVPGSFAQAIVNAAVARPAGAVGAPINAEEGIGLARVKAAQRPAQRGQHCTCAARSQKMAVEGRRSSLACWHLHALDLRRPVCQPEVASSSLVDPAIYSLSSSNLQRTSAGLGGPPHGQGCIRGAAQERIPRFAEGDVKVKPLHGLLPLADGCWFESASEMQPRPFRAASPVVDTGQG